MACSKCKKQEIREQYEKELVKVEKWVILTLVVFGIAAVYGVYSLITKLL